MNYSAPRTLEADPLSLRKVLPGSIGCLILAIALASCAGQAPPSGGPKDTQPPSVISAYPAPSSTFFRGSTIVLEFDEYVDRRSVEASLFISPTVGPLTFDWSGTEVEIRFSGSLKENTTYVVSVGTDVVDLRNRNRMEKAFSLAFSTGATIDPGTIEGKVYPATFAGSYAGIMVMAYKQSADGPDTLDARKRLPDYVTQTGSDGGFLFPHLSLASYKILAIREEYRNLLYDPETDEFAAASNSVHLTPEDTLQTGIVLRLAREDTTAPRLMKVTPVNRRLLIAEMSEPLDTGSVRLENVVVRDTVTRLPLRLFSIAQRLQKRTEFFIATEDQDAARTYEMEWRGVRDLTGRLIDSSASMIRFMGSDVRDTVRPSVDSFSLTDSARNVSLIPVLEISFAYPVQSVPWMDFVELRDSLGRKIRAEGQWRGDAAMTIRPERDLSGSAWYTIFVRTGSLKDWKGVSGKDTVQSISFRTLDENGLSSVSGFVRDASVTDTVGPLVVSASMTGQKTEVTRSTTIERPGPFHLDHLPEGQYVMHVFRDRNGNGVYDAGKVFPFEFSERFSVARDTLKLRARWPLEQVEVRLRSMGDAPVR